MVCEACLKHVHVDAGYTAWITSASIVAISYNLHMLRHHITLLRSELYVHALKVGDMLSHVKAIAFQGIHLEYHWSRAVGVVELHVTCASRVVTYISLLRLGVENLNNIACRPVDDERKQRRTYHLLTAARLHMQNARRIHCVRNSLLYQERQYDNLQSTI